MTDINGTVLMCSLENGVLFTLHKQKEYRIVQTKWISCSPFARGLMVSKLWHKRGDAVIKYTVFS